MRNETIVNWSDRWSRLSSSGPFAERLVGRVVVLPVFTLLALCIYAMLHRRVWHLLRLLRRALCTRTRNFKGAPGGDAAAANSGTIVLPSRHPRYIASMAALRKNGLETYDIAHHPSFSAMIGHVSELSELIATHAPLLFSLRMPLTLLLTRPRGLVNQIPWLLQTKLHKSSPALPLRSKP